MAYNVVRDKLTDYAVFKDGKLLLGTADIELPSIEYLTDTIKGPGIAGEVDMPTMGMTSSMEVKLNWRTVNEDLTELMAPRAHDLECRGAQAHYDSATGRIRQVPVVVKVRVLPKSGELGKFETGATTGSSNTMECVYLKVSVDGKTRVEIDKFARVFRINGTDFMAEIRAALGL
ncbi:phage major tail tube protein [Selenomonas sp. FOBRC9]|jgi:P2 family phage contractile tail tube protein|uniref:Tail tube protein n=1 Tax=Myoviridae sp. ctCdG12 TaxID=2825052 RepID=A0A8S5U2H9_9CAUD|nr:phage major tail tube protein [Selenomonas sp. FOBRC9]EJP28299.1 phage tail tube protein FII [Selenomonas sp. FOBRC9]DAF88664.1 MAG TPA: tail tube protein [Myoviridae sp. ctCdG12]DAY38599.1 MAG TPA: tail tube protein [Caudoviricetes sp.]